MLFSPGVFNPDPRLLATIPVGAEAADDEDVILIPFPPTVPLPLFGAVPVPTAVLGFLLTLLGCTPVPELFLRVCTTDAGILLGTLTLAGGTVAWVEVLLKR